MRCTICHTADKRGSLFRCLIAIGVIALLSFSKPALAAEIHVPADYSTIQAAVNAAKDNDTIRIASGVYRGQVEIGGKKLSLRGQPGTILRATSTMVPWNQSPGKHVPLMLVYSSEVTLRGLTFEGERLAGVYSGPNYGELVALYIWRSHADIEDCAFYGFREETPGAERAGGLWFQALHEGDFNLRVTKCVFADSYGGILAAGEAGRRNLQVTILDNTISGIGAVSTDLAMAGIDIAEGVSGVIAGNTVSGFSYVGTKDPFPISFGILAIHRANFPPSFGTLFPLVIEGNTLRDNQMHLSLNKADNVIVRNNRILGTAPGFLPVGVAVSGTNVLIAHNQFEAMPEGIRLYGNDPVFGDLLGYALDALVVSNRFCNVALPINQQSPAEATVVGTLQCDSVQPVLNIAPAVILSWTALDEGYRVQAAGSVDGPWTLLKGEPVWRAGEVTLTVEIENTSRFFRLWKP